MYKWGYVSWWSYTLCVIQDSTKLPLLKKCIVFGKTVKQTFEALEMVGQGANIMPWWSLEKTQRKHEGRRINAHWITKAKLSLQSSSLIMIYNKNIKVYSRTVNNTDKNELVESLCHYVSPASEKNLHFLSSCYCLREKNLWLSRRKVLCRFPQNWHLLATLDTICMLPCLPNTHTCFCCWCRPPSHATASPGALQLFVQLCRDTHCGTGSAA